VVFTQVPEAVSTIGVVVLALQVRQKAGLVEHVVQFTAVQGVDVVQMPDDGLAFWPQPG
jgi:hypothetical protein